MTKALDGRIILITGASRGIGRAMSLELARAGAHIIAAARTTGALEELDDAIEEETGQKATLVPMDVTDGEAIDRLGAALYERFGHLDGFFANAGILGPLSPLGHIDPKEWEKVIAVNLTANWRLVRSLDPLLRAADAGRAVFVSSGVAHSCKAYWGSYAVSKAAIECLARIYAHENEKTAVKVNIINPGPIRTAMRAQAFPGEDPQTLPTPAELARAMLPLFSPQLEDNGAIFDFKDGRLIKRA